MVGGKEGFSDDPSIEKGAGGTRGSAESTSRLSDGLAEAVARALAHCLAAGAGWGHAEDCGQDPVVAMLTSRSGEAATVRHPEACLIVAARRRMEDWIRRRRAEQTAMFQGM